MVFLNLFRKSSITPTEILLGNWHGQTIIFGLLQMRKVLETLDDILKGEDKVIVVSQWTSLLDLVRLVLKERNIKCAVLTGKVPIPDRAEVVDKFNRKDRSPRVSKRVIICTFITAHLILGPMLLYIHKTKLYRGRICTQ